MNDSGHFCHMEVVPGHGFLETSLGFVLISEIKDRGCKTMTANSENTHNILCTCVGSVVDDA